MALIYNKGKLLVDDGNGGRREATQADILNADLKFPEEMRSRIEESMRKQFGEVAGLTPGTPKQQMGITGMERWKIKNFADPAGARAYLEGLGYQVRDYGKPGWFGGWNFAVRKGPGDYWRTVDPRGFGVMGSDLVYDLADLTATAVESFVTGKAIAGGAAIGGAVGGPIGAFVGGSLGGIAGGGVTEALRQEAGVQMDMAERDPAQVASVALASGAGPTVEKGLGLAGRAIRAVGGKSLEAGKELFTEIGGKLTGAQRAGPLSEGEILKARIKDTARVLEKMPSWDQTVRDVRAGVARVAETDIPESIEASQIVNAIRGTPINLTAALDDLRELTLQKTARATGEAIPAPNLRREAGTLLDRIYAHLEASGQLAVRGRGQPTFVDTSRVPIEVVEELKTQIQNFASGKGGYGQKDISPRSQEIVAAASRLGFQLRQMVEQTADASGIVGQNGLNYSQNMAASANKVRQLSAMKSALGMAYEGPKGLERAQAWLEGMWGKNSSTRLAFAENFRKQFGFDVVIPSKRALIGTHFGDQGVPALTPKFSVGGSVLGPTIAGSVIGHTIGGPEGAATGGLIGLLGGPVITDVAGTIGASPRNIVRIGRMGMAAEARSRQFARAMQPLLAQPQRRMALTAALQEAARRSSFEEEQP